MPDGTQHAFAFTLPQQSKLRPGEIVLDFFAGGGGASEALRQALGRDPDVAVNHDPQALGMHAANHPLTRHMEADVWTIDIQREVGNSVSPPPLAAIARANLDTARVAERVAA